MASTLTSTMSRDEERQRLLAEIGEPLAFVEERLRRELRSRWPAVDEMVRYGALLGGKRLRPALLLLAGKATGQLNDDHIALGTVVEMIHTATLIHDDVIDQAETRRHLATANARWDNQTSVLLGDFLFTHAFHLASTVSSPVACRWIGSATNRVCEGELLQKTIRGQWQLSETEYFEVVEAKTAELCAVSCRLGAHFAKAQDSQVESMGEYGRLLGIAFQISDDLLDVLGDEAVTGKSLGTDLQQQRPTLPLLRGLHLASRRQQATLLELLRLSGDCGDGQLVPADYLSEIRAILAVCGAIEATRQTARDYSQRAAAVAESLPPSTAQAQLVRLASRLIDRQS